MRWRKTTWIRFVFAALIFAVFAWGLKYKLSLYDAPHAISHKMLHAKLLSNQERVGYTLPAPVSEALAPGTALPPWSLCLSLMISAGLPLAAEPGALWARGAWPFAGPPRAAMRAASLTSFFFRPPPSL